MVDSRITKFAKVLVNYSLRLKKGDFFIIEGSMVSEQLLKEVYKEAILVGAHPFINVNIEGITEIMLKLGSDEQISYIDPLEKVFFQNTQAILTVQGSSNTKNLINIDPAKLSLRSKSRNELFMGMLHRMESKELNWCGTQFPTHSAAMDANMSLWEYEDFLFEACHLNSDDPVSEWKKVHDEQQRLVDILNTKSHFEFISKDTHLTLSVEGRNWVNCDGQINFPDGEIFTSPVENSINGHIRFTYPAIHMANEVEDVVLTFKNGKVVNAAAKKGEEFLKEILATDEGASMVGEIAIGTNYNIKKFTKNILFDEKLGGTIHLAVGASLPETGGVNQSAIHWDMICDMKVGGEIYADGELIYKDGKFVI
ncbi:MAG TPA: aminopeptidase [Patescibacteria group bacterium]|nr:aminopeptidase [Patescibacteria group bacterium]